MIPCIAQVGNIKGTDFSSGETVVDYLQPFPPYGTGFHRYVFLLYKQSAPMDFSHFKREAPCRILSERTFSTSGKKLSQVDSVLL